MSINMPHRSRVRLVMLATLAITVLASCTGVPTPQPYSEPGREVSPTRQSAVGSLQQQADIALQNRDFPLAIETLQRAIRLEPRNPYNWHYLGLTYLEMGDFSRCRAMAERSSGFSEVDDRLLEANQRLLNRCVAN